MRKLSVIAALATVVACEQPKGPETSISEMETEIHKHAEMDTAIAKELTAAYEEYADQNPADTLSPLYLSRAADIYKEMDGKALKSVNVYNRIINEYPENPQSARAVFMIGYVFDEKLNDKERAAKSYEHFLEKYPDHALANDARSLLAIASDTLTDEELVAKWMEQAENKNDTNPKVE